jgi:hypothetical protein
MRAPDLELALLNNGGIGYNLNTVCTVLATSFAIHHFTAVINSVL